MIIGGNIAGLAAAIGLCRNGLGVTVLERMPRHPDVTGGLHIASNGLRAADRLGVADALQDAGAAVERFQFRTMRGSILWDIPAGDMARAAGTATIFTPRRALVAALVSALPPGVVRFGAEVTRIEQDRDGVSVHLGDAEVVRGDVALAADGLRSRIRTQVFGEVPLRYAGYQDWGAVIAFEDPAFPPGQFWTLWGDGLRVGVADIGSGSVFWAVSLPRPPTVATPPTRAELVAALGRWPAPVPQILELTHPDALYGAPIFDIAPRWPWTRGRVALLGDAAHATTPSTGRGASEALEDGVTVANALALVRDFGNARQVSDALASWARRRYARTAAVTRLSRHIGWVGRQSNANAVHAYLRATAWTGPNKYRRDFAQDVEPLRPRPQAWQAAVRAEDGRNRREADVLELMQDLYTGGEAVARRLIHPEAVIHFHTLSGGERGPEPVLRITSNLRAGFSDFAVDIEAVTSNEDTVVVYDTVSGTHDGRFQGLSPTGRRFTVTAMHRCRFEGERIVELAVVLDSIDVPQQLGALPGALDAFPPPVDWIARMRTRLRDRRFAPTRLSERPGPRAGGHR